MSVRAENFKNDRNFRIERFCLLILEIISRLEQQAVRARLQLLLTHQRVAAPASIRYTRAKRFPLRARFHLQLDAKPGRWAATRCVENMCGNHTHDDARAPAN